MGENRVYVEINGTQYVVPMDEFEAWIGTYLAKLVWANTRDGIQLVIYRVEFNARFSEPNKMAPVID